jgi:hypothetical protein
MDLHKPKPWHGLREFLKEYLIIVVGVLTALAAEAGVEALHWRHVAAQTEAQLRFGVDRDLFNAIMRVAELPCVNARTVELATALRSDAPAWRGTTVPGPSAATNAKPALPYMVREGKGIYARSAWDIAVAQGAVLHMPADREIRYARIYSTSAQIQDNQIAEGDLESRLGLLAYDRTLTREQRDGFLTVLFQLDAVETRIASANLRLLADARALKAPRPSDIDAWLAHERSVRGACVRDVAYPGT